MDNTNYFELPRPEELICYVGGYSVWTPSLVIRVNVPWDLSLNFKLIVPNPVFIQCPMIWKGAAFRLGTLEEMEAINERLSYKLSDENLRTQTKLYAAVVNAGSPHNHTVLLLSASRSAALKITMNTQRFE